MLYIVINPKAKRLCYRHYNNTAWMRCHDFCDRQHNLLSHLLSSPYLQYISINIFQCRQNRPNHTHTRILCLCITVRHCLPVCKGGRYGWIEGGLEGVGEALERASNDPHAYRDGVKFTIHGRFLFATGFLQGRHARG